LILSIVREGLIYRQKNGKAIDRAEIERLIVLLVRVEFEFPDLTDERCLASLNAPVVHRSVSEKSSALSSYEPTPTHHIRLSELRSKFLNLVVMENRQQAGLDLERLLKDTFGLFGLEPRGAFKVVGEQIDGSFLMDTQTFLIEAKWHKNPSAKIDLVSFSEKVRTKSSITRGVFISLEGITTEANQSIRDGRQANIFVGDGHDLVCVLEGEVALPELLRRKQRRLAEEGQIYVSFAKLHDQTQ